MLIHDALKNHKQGDGNAHSLVQAVLVANNLERIGDRVKNLVEIFYYQKTGKTLESEYE
jgi:phosphate uptake regulator